MTMRSETKERSAVQEEPSAVQTLIDEAIERTMLWAVPRRLRPNHLTALRFVLVPAVFLLFRAGFTGAAFAVFVFAACTDFLDGAMARVRNQVTELGTFIDPLADKLLVAAALLALGWDFLVIKVIVASITLELVAMAFGAVDWARSGRVVRANVFGKVKMVLLSVGLSLFLLGRALAADAVVEAAVWILWAALAFAFASGVKFAAARRRKGSVGMEAENT
jgi:CDP-diacylglycerol--glycerol-3-phosphate 3-phosphatidyltransferase